MCRYSFWALESTIPQPMFFTFFILASVIGFCAGRWKSLRWKNLETPLRARALPNYYALYLSLWTTAPLLAGVILCQFVSCDKILFAGNISLEPVTLLAFSILGWSYGWPNIRPNFPARHALERLIKNFLFLCASCAIFITLAVAFSMIFETLRFFQKVPIFDFFTGTKWNPTSSLSGVEGSYGALPLFSGTFLITSIALIIAAPTGIFSAIYLSCYAHPRTRAWLKPALEILAGIPTVVYGFFTIVAVAPILRHLGLKIGLDIEAESALGAGIVMGVMILPFMSSLSDDVINAVPKTLKDGSLALGSTLSETIKNVILPASLPGITAALLLAISRAIGETMLVVMALGLSAQLTLNPLDSVTTVTVQIVALLTGDQEFNSPGPLSAFALGLTLFCITLTLNTIALRVVRNYRARYEFH